jgi:hypothetical protein
MSELATQPAEKMPKKKSGFDKWEIDSAVDTLLRAEEIKQNAALMKEVKKKMNDKAKAEMAMKD